MPTPSNTVAAKLPRILATITVVIGALMLILGVTMYVVTSQQLRDQHISVAAVTADAPGALAGKPVAGPFTALAQVNAIAHHTDAATGGKTYGQLPNVATSDGKTYNKDLTADKSTDGVAHAKGDPLSQTDAASYAARATAQTSAFLRSSLLLSVLAFGVSALIAGLGLLFALIGVTQSLTLRQTAQTATASARTHESKK